MERLRCVQFNGDHQSCNGEISRLMGSLFLFVARLSSLIVIFHECLMKNLSRLTCPADCQEKNELIVRIYAFSKDRYEIEKDLKIII